MWLCSVPAILIVWPLAHSFFVAMGLTPEGGAAMAATTALGVGVLAIPIEIIVERRRWWPAGVAAVAALACLAVAVSETRYSDRHPRPVNVVYAMDADARTAHWAVRARWADTWFVQFLGAAPRPGRPLALVQPWSSADGVPGFLHGDAPPRTCRHRRRALSAPCPPRAAVTSPSASCPGGKATCCLSGSTACPPSTSSVDGTPVSGAFTRRAPDDTAWTLEYFNAPASGATVAMTLRGSQPLTVAVAERAHGLPELPGTAHAPRPASLMPIQAGDQTIVRRTYTF